jgi:hypothetical protein
MDITEITDEVGNDLTPEIQGAVPCEECGAPLDRLQRYCVSCGTRRLAVPDPATAYLAQASARVRVRQHRAAGVPGGSRGRGRFGNTTALLALIAILIAIGVGVLIGHGIAGSSTVEPPSVTTPATTTAGTPGTSKASSSGVDNATGKAYLNKALGNSGSSVTVP